MRNLLLPFANQFHRAKECGELEVIKTPRKKKEREAQDESNA